MPAAWLRLAWASLLHNVAFEAAKLLPDFHFQSEKEA